MGHSVFAGGNDKNALMANSVDEHFKLDYSDYRDINDVCQNNHFDLIIPCCNDLSVSALAKSDFAHLTKLDQSNLVAQYTSNSVFVNSFHSV